MDFLKQIKVSAIQKSMQLTWLFALLAGITFVDCTLMIQYGEGVTLVSWGWIKNTLDIQDLLLGVGVFSFIFAAVLPGFWFGVWPFILIGISYFVKDPNFLDENPRKGYQRVDSLLVKAAKDNNSALMKYCERHEHEVELKNVLSLCSQGMIIFTVGAWFFSAEGNQPIILNFYDSWASQPWYIERPLNFVAGIFCFAVVMMVGLKKSPGSEFVRFPDDMHNNRLHDDRAFAAAQLPTDA